MKRLLLPKGPLRLSPELERRLARNIALAALGMLPGGLILLAELLAGASGDMILVALAFMGLGALPMLVVYAGYLRQRWTCADPVELHATVTSRTEMVYNGVPTKAITYNYRLPPAPNAKRIVRERRAVFDLTDGAPLFADERGELLVVLVPRKGWGTPVVVRSDYYPIALDPETRDRLRHRQIVDRLAISYGRGFRNVDVVARSLRRLLAAEAKERLPERPAEQWSLDAQYDAGNALISVQRLARSVAEAFGFDAGTIVVRFDEKMVAAGEVEYEPGSGFFIAVNKEFARRPRVLVAILAHEVAHIFLATHGLVPDNRFDNEIMTDVAAALWGFGAAMIECHQTRFVYAGEFAQTGRREMTDLGYITPDECAYVLAKVQDTRPLQRRAERHARRAYRRGRHRAAREARTPPLVAAWPHRRVWYLLRRRVLQVGEGPRRTETGGYELSAEQVTFRCPRCTQNLRLPLHKRGTATCSGCGLKLPFSS